MWGWRVLSAYLPRVLEFSLCNDPLPMSFISVSLLGHFSQHTNMLSCCAFKKQTFDPRSSAFTIPLLCSARAASPRVLSRHSPFQLSSTLLHWNGFYQGHQWSPFCQIQGQVFVLLSLSLIAVFNTDDIIEHVFLVLTLFSYFCILIFWCSGI